MKNIRIKKKTVPLFRVILIVSGVFAILWLVWTWIDINYLPSTTPGLPLSSKEQSLPVSLYFIAENGVSLEPENRMISLIDQSFSEKIKKTIEALIAGPEDRRKYRVIPADTKLLDLFIDEKSNLYLNFSREFKGESASSFYSEYLFENAIAGTVKKNFRDIKAIQLLVEGQRDEDLFGHLNAAKAFTLDETVIR